MTIALFEYNYKYDSLEEFEKDFNAFFSKSEGLLMSIKLIDMLVFTLLQQFCSK